MSNFPKINDTVRIGKGKVEYRVVNVIHLNELGTGAVTVESKNTGKVQVVEQARVTVVESAPIVIEDAPVPVIEAQDAEDFDPRTDRRQSDYGLDILSAVLHKNPRAGAHNVNPLKSVKGKRRKVRDRVRAQRTQVRKLSEAYNTVRRQNGWDFAA